MDRLGRHAVVDGFGAESQVLNDAEALAVLLVGACQQTGATVLSTSKHKFAPYGVTVVLLLAESHASIHTYPEHGAYMADVFTCGDVDPMPAVDAIARALGGVVDIRVRNRGVRTHCKMEIHCAVQATT